MKKFYLAFTALLGSLPFAASAQTILSEDFESITTSTEYYTPQYPEGWTTVDSYLGNTPQYRWHTLYDEKGTITGKYCASVDAPMSINGSDAEGKGPREEILLTKELDLDDTYQLSFDWKAASASALDNQEYDFQVRVVEGDDVAGAKTLWSFQNKEQLQESGVTVWPWSGWNTYPSKVDLSEYKGKKVKIAFVYKMLKATANVLYLDNVIVKKFTPVNTPKAEISRRIYSFGKVVIGSKVYSDPFTLKNVGKAGLKITSVECPAGVSVNLDKNVNLGANESVSFNVIYEASMSSSADGTITIKTNGGDVTIRVTAELTMLPENATYETFEKAFPPAGWTNEGWSWSNYALEGDHSASSSVDLSGATGLTSPRLDLSEGSHKVEFKYYNQFETETEGAQPENDVTLEFSTDGGATWKTVWTASKDDVNVIKTATVDLGSPASDNCYLKWKYGEIAYDSENVPEISVFFVDQVVLPKVYGMGGVPQLSTVVSPADKATDLYNKNITLEWSRALLATGYKLYLGTDAAASNILNGQDMKDVTTYTIPSCEYATTYNWKVVPYNEKGDAKDAAIWSFTTIADQTVSSFPYTQTFNDDTFPALGWAVEAEGYTKWSNNNIDPYEGKYSVSVSAGGNEVTSNLLTPDFNLPADPVEISFYWGNAMPVNLKKDPSGLVENTSKADDGIDACFFEVFADGKWQQKAIMSDKNNEYWCLERVDLSEFAGKKVSFRWRYVCHDLMKTTGVGLDLVTIDAVSDNKAAFNVSEWNAGKVNYGKSYNSTQALSLLNNGVSTLTVKTVEFATQNFETSLSAGTKIEPKKGASFTLKFNAGSSASLVEDNMKVTFDNGYSVSLPVKGDALAIDTKYYNFDSDEPGSTKPEGFTTIDVDKVSTIAMTGLQYPMRGAPVAFTVQQDADWNNVIEPVSGTQALVAIAIDDENLEAEDWIVSDKVKATAQSKFTFYARNWESTLSILPSAQSSIEVLVSTTSNTDRTTFETAMEKVTMPYFDDEKGWDLYTVDLSKYAGKEIYVALRHTVKNGLAAFFDDFTFEHFDGINGGIESVAAGGVKVYPNPATDVVFINGVENADVTVTSVAGAVVLQANGVDQVNVSDLSAGIYLLTVKSENGTFTTRIIKK